MKAGLKIGDSHTFQVTITDAMQPDFARMMNDPDLKSPHPLYGTAAMITQMEWAARQHILPYLEPGEEGVGAQIQIQHLHPAPMDARVTITSEVIQLDAKRVTSQVSAKVGDTLIGEGKFVQVLVQRDVLYDRANRLLMHETVSTDDPESAIAQLRSVDQQTAFSVSLLRWESPFPCTRYDEWLICRLRLNTASMNEIIEGPYLLRFEIEELVETLKGLQNGDVAFYQSDYMEESGLSVELQRESVLDPIVAAIGFQKKPPIYFKIDPMGIPAFCENIIAQLEQLLALL